MKDVFEAVDRAFIQGARRNPAPSGTEDLSGTASIGIGEFSIGSPVGASSATESLPR